MTTLGELSLWVALLMAAWSAATSIAAAALGRGDLAESGRRALAAALVLSVVASLGLWAAFLGRDYTRSYVAAHSNANLPIAYAIAAFWAGGGGWLLSCATALTVCTWFALRGLGDGSRTGTSSARIAAALTALLCVALVTVCFGANPFAQLDFAVADGSGLDPRLQTVGFLIIPPLEALAYAAMVVACVLTLDERARYNAGRWLRLATMLLSLALAARIWWSYTSLEGERFWRWGIGESATLGLWLIAAAARHDAATVHGRSEAQPGRLLAVIALALVAVGTVFGGPLSMFSGSVTGDALAPRVWVGAMVVAVPSLALLRSPSRSGASASAPVAQEPMTRRHGALVGAAALIALAATVVVSVIAPMVEAWVEGKPADGSWVGDTSMRIAGPLLLAALTFAPRASPRHAQPWRPRTIAAPLVLAGMGTVALTLVGITSAYVLIAASLGVLALCMIARDFALGGRAALTQVLSHAGFATIVVGLCLTSLTTQRELTVRPGEAFEFRDPLGRNWRLVGQGVSLYDVLNRRVIAVTLDAFREGVAKGLVKTEKRQSVDTHGESLGDPLTGVGLLRTVQTDLRLELLDASGEVARVTVAFVPFAELVWLGGLLVICGAVTDVAVGRKDRA